MVQARKTAFSLVELLVVVAVLSVLAGLLAPALRHAKLQACQIQNRTNQKSIVSALYYYAVDNRDRFPPSMATIGNRGPFWGWWEPTTIITHRENNPLHEHRSISSYLGNYISGPEIFFCPNSPENYPYTQEAWTAGDAWNNPETRENHDYLFGSYSFYWGYVGYSPQSKFQGPRKISRRGKESTLLVSDTLAYDNWREEGAFISCEMFNKTGVTERRARSCAYWHCLKNDDNTSLDSLGLRLQGGFVDGHVESYFATETTPVQVSSTSNGCTPNMKYGTFFIPTSSLH